MHRGAVLLFALVWIAGVMFSAPQASSLQTPPTVAAPAGTADILARYCVGCHNARIRSGELALDTVDPAHVAIDAPVWEKVLRRLRAGAMPPAGMPRPDEATYDRLIVSLEAALDAAARSRPNPGRPLLHRLNRAEYANAIRDLLSLEVDVAPLLPPDDSTQGFDNVADVLGVSPLLLERYLAAADKISGLAVGDPDTGAGSETYRVRQDLSQNQHIEGLPFGTVGGVLVRSTLPLDGEYVISVRLMRTNTGAMRGLEFPHQLETVVDGRRVHLASFGGETDLRAEYQNPTTAGDLVDARLRVRVPLGAGPHSIGVGFLQKSTAASITRLQPFLRAADTIETSGDPHVDMLVIAGPFNPTGPGDTPSRRRIFLCRPQSSVTETACARRIIATLARRAYRRPVLEPELTGLLDFFRAGRTARGGFDAGIQMALRRILASPKFVFRAEADARVPAGTPYPVSDIELASRLSFFLWSSIPDDELLDSAIQGRLRKPGVLEHQVRRMLADPRSGAIVQNFAGQWLYLRNLRSLQPNSTEFPDFDDNLRQAFQREVELFFDSIMREDRSVVDLLTADYTFVNERLARHYKIPNIYGSRFRRVTLADDARRGLLGKGALLMVTSQADRTSPVLRGKWVLENLVGTAPPPPPPVVPSLDTGAAAKARTMRARLEAHRASPACAGCHRVMDPIGFALENFDAVGVWRTHEADMPINVGGQFWDGTSLDGAVGLRQALLKRPQAFVHTLTEKLLTYALGRSLDYYDMPAVRAIVRQAAASEYRFSSIVSGIVTSMPFQMRARLAQDEATPRAVTTATR